ncbi:hypothetical protein Q9966_012947 [Columba livia]|nr:hypothetical protein Q9966_012947 [Columba livia]
MGGGQVAIGVGRGTLCGGMEDDPAVLELGTASLEQLLRSALLGGVVEDVGVICWDPTQGHPTGSERVSVPIIICIILGALLCLVLALLAGQVLSARDGCRGSSAEESLTQLQLYHEDVSFHCRQPPVFSDVLVLPGDDPVDGYDDAREVSDPGEDIAPGQGAWEMPRVPEKGAGPRGVPRGGDVPSQRRARFCGAEGDTSSLSLESMGYDDAEEVSLAHPHKDTEAVTLDLGAQQSLSPTTAEPIPAMQLGAARRKEMSVQLGEP